MIGCEGLWCSYGQLSAETVEADCQDSRRNMAVTLFRQLGDKQEPLQCKMEVTKFNHCGIYAQCVTAKSFRLR